MKYLLATKNKAKIKYYGTKLKESGIDILTLNDLNISIDIAENGQSPRENAIIKATTYNQLSNLTTIALDEGLFFKNIPEEIQPGTHVRRINNKRLNDNEMIDYYISLINQYGNNGTLAGYFLKSVAIASGGDIYTFEYKADCQFSNHQSSIIDEGYPLDSIQIISPFNKFKSELTEEEKKIAMNIEQNAILDFILKTITTIDQNRKVR